MKTPSVVLVTSWPYPHVGGVSSHIRLLAKSLGMSDSDVISHKQIEALSESRVKWVIRRMQWRVRKTLNVETISFHAEALTSLLSALRCDIVHCHDAIATWAALRARRRFGKSFKIVSTIHGPVSRHMIEEGFSNESPDVKKVEQCEREAWAGCDLIIAVDTAQRDIAIAQGADRRKTRIIPNAVDRALLEEQVAALPLTRSESRAWVFVPRRLSPKNGIEYAIRAVAVMRQPPRLLIAGNGPEREKLIALSSELGVSHLVNFLGGLDHEIMIPMMASADIVLVPSIPIHGIVEATSIATIEAMAIGKPVIASEIGGLIELIQNGVNGFLVQPGSPEELATAIEKLLSSPQLRHSIGNAAKRAVVEKFSSEQWYSRHLAVYAEVLLGHTATIEP